MYLSDLSDCGDDITKMLSVINCYEANSEIGVEISSVHNYRLDWDNLDTLAHLLWPKDGPYDRSDSFQINTSAAGDCLPCSISRLVAEMEFHAWKMRTHMTIEAVKNRTWYLDHNNLILLCPPLDSSDLLPAKYAMLSSSNVNKVVKCYDREVTRCLRTRQECGIWQIHQFSSVVR